LRAWLSPGSAEISLFAVVSGCLDSLIQRIGRIQVVPCGDAQPSTADLRLQPERIGGHAQEDPLGFHVGHPLGEEPAQTQRVLDQREGALGLDVPVEPCLHALFAGDVRQRIRPVLLHDRVVLHPFEPLFGGLRLHARLALRAARTALLRLIQARPVRPLPDRIVQYGVVGVPELALLPVVGHVQLAPRVLSYLTLLVLLIGLSLDVGVHAPVLQVPIVLHAVVAAVGAHPLVVESQALAQLLHCRHECVLVGAVAAAVRADDVTRVDDVLYVVARLELPVEHVVLLHPHEGGILIGLAHASAPLRPHPVPCARVQVQLLRIFQQPLGEHPLEAFAVPAALPAGAVDDLLRVDCGNHRIQGLPRLGLGPHRRRAVQVIVSKVPGMELGCVAHQLGQVLLYCAQPHERILAGFRLDLRPVDEGDFPPQLSQLVEPADALGKNIPDGFRIAADKPVDGAVVGRPAALQGVDADQVPPAQRLDLPAAEAALQPRIGEDVQHLPGRGCIGPAADLLAFGETTIVERPEQRMQCLDGVLQVKLERDGEVEEELTILIESCTIHMCS